MNLNFKICTILYFIGIVQSYSFTTISSTISNTPGVKTMVIDDAQTYAYITDDHGSLFKVDISTGAKTTILSNGAGGNCYAIGLFGFNGAAASAYDKLLFGGWQRFNQYSSLTTGGIKTTPFSVSGYGGTYTIAETYFWLKCIIADPTNKLLYMSDTYAASPTQGKGAIWKLDISGASFSSGSLTRLALTLNGANYDNAIGNPYGLALRGSNLYFVEETGNKVCKFDVNTLAVIQIITSGIARPYGIVVDSAEAYAYISTWDTPANGILKVDLSTNTFITLTTAPASVCSMIFNSAETHIYMTADNALVKMNVVPSVVGGSGGGGSSPSDSSKSKKDNKLLFLLFLVVLIPITCVFYFFVGKRRRRKVSKEREEVPQNEEETPQNEVDAIEHHIGMRVL